MLLFLKRIVLKQQRDSELLPKIKLCSFTEISLGQKEPNSGAERDSKIPKIQKGSVLGVWFSPITTSLRSPAPFGKGSISGLLWQPRGAVVRHWRSGTAHHPSSAPGIP